MEFGRRLLPQVVDYCARACPDKIYASIPNSNHDLSHGFRDISMAHLSRMVDQLSWWLEEVLGMGGLDAIGYIGPSDIRYTVVFLAAVKCEYKVLFISPRNQPRQNRDMLKRSGCVHLLYAQEMNQVVETLQLGDGLIRLIPSLDELLQTPLDVKPYLYEKSFEDAQDEPCLILHSSGSTGDPKLVTMTHGTFACTDNDRNVPVPEGRRPQNAAQFDFMGGGKFYSCFPPYHLAGVHVYIDLPIFYSNASVVLGPYNLPPNGHLVSEILKYQEVRALYVPPSIIEEWASEPVSATQVKQLDFILFGGAPLSPKIGQRLNEVTNVCQLYGSLEIGQVQLLLPRPGQWRYMEFNPFEEVDMQPMGDGTFEMVLHQEPKLAQHRSLWHNFPDVKEWRTNDLFIQHPSDPGLWRFYGRLDDLIVLSTSHKLRPVEMETIIQGNPLVSGALIVGQGKPEPLLIIELKPEGLPAGHDAQTLIDRIWPTVVEANSIAPSYAKIDRSRVILAALGKPFTRAPKGSVIRKLTTRAYADAIEAAYGNGSKILAAASLTADAVDHRPIADLVLPDLKQFVRHHISTHIQHLQLSDTENLFLCGLDSLGAAALGRNLRKDIIRQVKPTGGNYDSIAISPRTVYKNPSIEGLAHVVLDILTNHQTSGNTAAGTDLRSLEQAAADLTGSLSRKTGTI
ncbi:hypothetical protein F5Y19DRAFT_490382 [Xylariaceae sp. FL1651]|nr:hypothetical protein F5Y19DRAFT_490382 [Xylariaceae sp. FL1651]